MADDNLSNTTFSVLMARFIEEISSKLNQNKTSNNEEILSQIKTILSDIKTSQSQNSTNQNGSTHTTNHDDIREMSNAVRNAINQATQSGDNLLQNQKALKTVLEEMATDEKNKENELSSNLNNSFNDIKRELSTLHMKVDKQLSTGKLELGPFTGFVDMMQKSEDYYRNAVSMGQDYGGSIVNMREVMSRSGMTLEQFNKALITGSQGLRMMGMTTFSSFAGAVNASVKALGDLGMSGDQLSDAMSVYSDGLRTSGRLGTLTTQQMLSGFREFATSATQLAHDMGISREEAMGRLNQARSEPDTNLLMRRLTEEQRKSIDMIMGSVNNNPVLKSLVNSELYSAMTGNAAPTKEVNTMLSASGPAAFQSYREQTELLRRSRNAATDEERSALQSEWFKSLQRMGSNITENQAYQQHYGNQYGQSAVNLYDAIQKMNPNQVVTNIQNRPKSDAEIGGRNDNLTSSVLQTNHTMQEFVNHYDMFKNQIISSNRDLISKTIDAYNSMEQFLTRRIDDLTNMIKAIGPASNSLSYIAGTAANHPMATIGLLGAASIIGHGIMGRLAKSIFSAGKNYMELNSLRANRITEGTGSSRSYRVLTGIADKLKSITPSSLRQSITNIPSKIPSILKNSVNDIKGSSALRIAGKVATPLAIAGTAYGLYSDASTILKNDNNNDSQDKKRNNERERYRAWADSISTIIGGGVGAGVGLLSGGSLSVPAALIGSSVSSTLTNAMDVGGHVYDWTHPKINQTKDITTKNKESDNKNNVSLQPNQNNTIINPITNNVKQENKNQDEIKLLADKLDYSNILLKQMISKLDDMNRTIKNSSPTMN